MKKVFRLLTGLLCVSAVMTACKPDPAPVLPEFPSKVTRTVGAGEIVNLTFAANLDWEISMNQEEATYFSLVDGGNSVYSLRGKASDDVKVQVKVAELKDLDNNHVCVLTMKMGEQEQVVAELTLAKTDRVINIYPVQMDEWGFIYAESGDLTYAYESSTVGEDGMEMVWPEGLNGYMTRFMVVSNFDWSVDGTPEWIMPIVGGESGVTEVWLRGDASKYPLEGDEVTLKFVDANTTTLEVATLKVSIPAAADYFVADFAETTKFNNAGNPYNSMLGDYVEGAATGYVTAVDGIQVVPFAFVSQYGMHMPSTDLDWVTATIAAWNEEDTSVIQSRSVEVSVASNEGPARSAMVFALPADMSTDPYDMAEFADGMPTGEVAEAYLPYLLTTIEQEGAPATIEYEHAYGEEITFGISANGGSWPHNELGNATERYDLLYTKDWDNDDVTFISKKEISNIYISILNEQGQFYNVENDMDLTWLRYWRPQNDNTRFKVQMNINHPTATAAYNENTGDYEGGLYIEYADGTSATIYCRYNENAAGGGSEGINLEFAYPEYAVDIDGSWLEKVTSGPHYNYCSMNCGVTEVWHVTFTKEYHTMSMINGLNPSYFYENPDDAEWLSFEYSEGGSMITTNAANGNGKTGYFLFGESIENAEFALAVTLDIAE